MGWVGFVLVVTACSAWGWQRATELGRRPGDLRILRTALQALESEIAFGAVPLPEAFARIAGFYPDPAATLFRTAAARLAPPRSLGAAAAWDEAVAAAVRTGGLTPDDRAILRAVGPYLGATDRDDQVRHLRLAMARLEAAEAVARDLDQRWGRIYRYGGLLAGAFIGLLLL
ncbi:stage III sporulation protein AB [Thermaerobacter marianensis DSM 12885]|uniref:Stage III sporulation protein AB n=1 Tax=Thermaerobacter marianensis (strain ATCC 700841 / DSM 12885 / JCM 10246 / 7p75a) TaxID=644966 RepID=E6SL65_THEM7|nr:stage III sporulation protein AB [Thermaerobacter marianensis]ADU51296.1 stage III sporulation protein AB [Thermaerobacter marianensis DSM 12885]